MSLRDIHKTKMENEEEIKKINLEIQKRSNDIKRYRAIIESQQSDISLLEKKREYYKAPYDLPSYNLRYSVISLIDYRYKMYSCLDFGGGVWLVEGYKLNGEWLKFGFQNRRNFETLCVIFKDGNSLLLNLDKPKETTMSGRQKRNYIEKCTKYEAYSNSSDYIKKLVETLKNIALDNLPDDELIKQIGKI